MAIFGVSKHVFDYWRNEHQKEARELREKYWELWHRHERLLKHLGLEEVTINKKEIQKVKP